MAKKAATARGGTPGAALAPRLSPEKASSSASTLKTGRKAVALLTLTDIGDHIASTFDMPKSHAKIYLAEAVALIARNLRKGNKVRIAGLGVFQVKKRAARKGRNPSSGEPIKIKATKRVGFAVARDLKVKL